MFVFVSSADKAIEANCNERYKELHEEFSSLSLSLTLLVVDSDDGFVVVVVVLSVVKHAIDEYAITKLNRMF